MADYNSIHTGAEIDAAVSFYKDNYVEDSWTPAIKFGGNSVGMEYVIQEGLYTKIGRQVTLTARIILSAKGESTGNITIEGMPFTSKNVDGADSAVTLRFVNVSFENVFGGYIAKNGTYIILGEITEAGIWTMLTNNNFTDDTNIILTVTYFTD